MTKAKFIKDESDFGGYWVKGVKEFKGHAGEPCLQCSVYKDGKKIGFFSEDSRGGPANLHDFSKNDESVLCSFAEKWDEEPWPESYHSFIVAIAEAVDSNRRIKRQCKTKTLFMVDGETYLIKAVFASNVDRIKGILTKKYGDGNFTIANEQL